MSRKAWVIGEKIEICVHAVAQQGHPKTYFKKLKKRVKNKEKDHFEHFELLVACRPLTH